MTIQYYIKSVYGRNNLYIKDADQATAISRLTNKKTVDENDLEALHSLGYKTERVLAPAII